MIALKSKDDDTWTDKDHKELKYNEDRAVYRPFYSSSWRYEERRSKMIRVYFMRRKRKTAEEKKECLA